jgi:FAD binding domain
MMPAAAAQWQTTCANMRSHMCTPTVQNHYARRPPRAFRKCAWSSRHSRGQEPRGAISQQLTAHAQRPAEVVVLGAGAAGLTAAYFAALSGAKVLLKPVMHGNRTLHAAIGSQNPARTPLRVSPPLEKNNQFEPIIVIHDCGHPGARPGADRRSRQEDPYVRRVSLQYSASRSGPADRLLL